MLDDALTRAAVSALEDIKAHDITVIDVRALTSLFDTVIVASGDSARQNKALARHVQDEAKTVGGSVFGIEGEGSGEWVLVDLGDVVVHIMQPAIRDYYNLEELWGGTRPLPGRPTGLKTLVRASEPAATVHPAGTAS